MQNPSPKSSRKPNEATDVDDDLIPGIPDTFENVVKALVKPQPKKPYEWKREEKSPNPVTDPAS